MLMSWRGSCALSLGLGYLSFIGCADDASSSAGGAADGGGGSVNSGGSGGSGAISQGGAGEGGAVQGGEGGAGGDLTLVDPLADVPAVTLALGDFQFTEGTVWLPALGVLRFSDIPASQILELDPATGNSTVWREPSNQTNGNGLAPNGDIIMCEHAARRVSRSSAAGAPNVTDVATNYMGMAFNSPNDVIVRSDGQMYFTDPTYGLGGGSQEIPWRGVYRVDTSGGVSLVGDEYGQPNGIALSPDESKLYVSDSQDGGLFVYDVAPDGSTGARSLLIDAPPSDGMAVDDAGNLYLTTSAGVEVYRADGTAWGTLAVPEQPANCTFGGEGRRELFITARTSLYRVQLNVPGLP
jgi:gluconolactonase